MLFDGDISCKDYYYYYYYYYYFTAIDLLLGGNIPYAGTDKTNKNNFYENIKIRMDN
jgi:hypothetical protein